MQSCDTVYSTDTTQYLLCIEVNVRDTSVHTDLILYGYAKYVFSFFNHSCLSFIFDFNIRNELMLMEKIACVFTDAALHLTIITVSFSIILLILHESMSSSVLVMTQLDLG